ncbi:hypothetical protein [Halobaculum sp. MBLA0143]|uniref:hypothetical protein n=1 Tax=Halobaculum sp. MBLA0143 TaxID=3079933 RepID=UPI003525016B
MERADPAQTGVRVGRSVGVATGVATVSVAAFGAGSPYHGGELLVQVTGIDARVATAIVVGDAVVAAVVRYTVCYAVGSLLGAYYGWVSNRAPLALGLAATAVGAVDALLSITRPTLAVVFFAAWLGFVPVFLRRAPAEPTTGDDPVRLG